MAPRRCSQHAAGVNRTYLSELQKGASYPGLEIIAKLPTVLEVEPAEGWSSPSTGRTPREGCHRHCWRDRGLRPARRIA
jgi:hypothetical protein